MPVPTTRRRARARTVILTSALSVLALATAAPALAGSTTAPLPNGADLTVEVTSPVDGDTFVVPAGATTVDVPASGSASVAVGTPSVSWVYIVDVSGSTSFACGGSTILGCEKAAVAGLNDLVVTDGSAIDVGLGIFAEGGAAADISSSAGNQLVTAPTSPDVDTVIGSISEGGVAQFTPRSVGSGFTNFAAGLQAADTIVQAAAGTSVNVVFLSDGASNTGGGSFAAALAAVSSDATIYPFAVGASASCSAGTDGTLDEMATASGTSCFSVPDPADLPDVIKNVTATSLTGLAVEVDSGAATETVVPALPQAGPTSVAWTAPLEDLAPGSHEVCATATGVGPASDATAEESVERCETFSVFGFALTLPTATNELGSDDTHTVTATVSGPAGELGGWPVDFSVDTGPNAGESGTCAPASCQTNASGQVTFTYTVPMEPDSLGTDTISGTLDVNGDTVALEVEKLWQDTTPPVAECTPSTNPSGHTPAAPGKGGQGQNQDGFYRLLASDDVWPSDSLEVFVKDTQSPTVFGPFGVDTDVKWTEANGAKPSQKRGSGEVEWKLKGKGDMEVYAVDGSGNVSDTVVCLVPNAPK
ncbi:MAG: vWA domain-containing protein [Ornithinibacter sp.]